MPSRLARLALAVALVTSGLVAAVLASPAGASSPTETTITMQGSTYRPSAPAGGTDDYHCTLVNPHVTKNAYIVQAHFYPNSIEVHHAILFLIPPDLAARAVADDKGGKGWTCFGESALPGTASGSQISNTPWLTAWAPGPRCRRRTGRNRRLAARRQPRRRADPLQPPAG